MSIPTMQQAMGTDLAQLFIRDMPAECMIGANQYAILLDDLIGDEQEEYGGPDEVSLQRVHFLTSEKPTIQIGSLLSVRQKSTAKWESKIVLSFVLSADGNELIATVRGD